MLASEQHVPRVADVRKHLAVRTVTPILIPADCTDGFVGAYWRRPEAYLDPVVSAGMSTLAQLRPRDRARGMARLEQDLTSGAWDDRYGYLRQLPEFDIGYRLVIAE